jgi:hypothetical protein
MLWYDFIETKYLGGDLKGKVIIQRQWHGNNLEWEGQKSVD